MKKGLKILLIVIGIIILCFILDLIFIFKLNRPLFAIRQDNGDSINIVYKGLIYDTYNCLENSSMQIVFKWKKYSCDNTIKITIEELENIHKEVDDSIEKYRENNEYHNVASTGVDREKYRLIIELVDNSTEQQKWFRENIYDSKYIVFKQGGPYTTSNGNTIKPNLFNRNEIIKVTIDNYSQYKNNFEYSDKDTIDTIYNLFKNLETNIESESSEPENPEELYKVIFFNSENMLIESDNDIFKSTIYVYRKNNKYYAEETKNGIYEITEKTFNTIKNYTK